MVWPEVGREGGGADGRRWRNLELIKGFFSGPRGEHDGGAGFSIGSRVWVESNREVLGFRFLLQFSRTRDEDDAGMGVMTRVHS